MKLNFIKTNPTENMTVFILDQVSRDEYVNIAKKIMGYNNVNAEQVGFIEKATGQNGEACVRLHMMGGEFCGNATRALAAVVVHRGQCKINNVNEKTHLSLEVSGADKPIECKVIQNGGDGKFISGVEMPLHEKIYDYEVEYDNLIHRGIVVEFQGIIHLVVEGNDILSREGFFQQVKESFKDKDYDALGIMFYDEKDYSMVPLVYVKGTDSLIWERGCGSGASALGIAVSYRQNNLVDIIVRQPGGELKVTTEWDGSDVTGLFLNGDVEIVAEGMLIV